MSPYYCFFAALTLWLCAVLAYGLRCARLDLEAVALAQCPVNETLRQWSEAIDAFGRACGVTAAQATAAAEAFAKAFVDVLQPWKLEGLQADPVTWTGWLSASWHLYRTGGRYKVALSEAWDAFGREVDAIGMPE